MAKKREPLKIDMSFEDAVRHILKAPPMPKDALTDPSKLRIALQQTRRKKTKKSKGR